MRILTTMVLSLALIANAFAQKDKIKEEIKTMKVGFITKELALTTEESQKFWPVYNDYQDKLEKLRKERMKTLKSAKSKGGLDSLSNAEVEKIVDKGMSLEETELQIKQEFLTKVKTILPIKKVAKLYKAEYDFRREIIKKMK